MEREIRKRFELKRRRSRGKRRSNSTPNSSLNIKMADSVSAIDREMDASSSEDEMEQEKDESDDSADDEKSEDAMESRITELEQQVIANPYNYDPHLELIKCTKKNGDLMKLREARERMSKIFPLTEDLWLDWIRDESNLAVSDEGREAVHKLFERAIKDYMSVEVWLEYAQYSIGSMGMKDGIEKCRDIFERAVTACGLHVTKGSILWEAYREFELALLATLQHVGQESDDENKERVVQQKAKILNLFKRQLSIPLIDMERSYEELKEWLEPEEQVSANIETGYQKSLEKLAKIQSFEDQLLLAEPPRTTAFQSYIDYEFSEGEPSRIQCIFERALVDNCLVSDLWVQYTNYLVTQLKIDSVVLPVYERAVRNCPWHVGHWQGYLKAMERYNQPHEKIKELADRALGAGFTKSQEFLELWLVYLDYLRRRATEREDGDLNKDAVKDLRDTFEQADNHLNEYFGQDGDPNCSIKQYWARTEARHLNNMEKCRQLWSEILQAGHGKTAQMWLQFAQLELCYGDSKHLRKLFTRGLQAASDWPELLADMWINFERDDGSLEQFESASAKIAAKMKIVEEKRNKEKESRLEAKETSKSKKKKNSPELGPTVIKRRVQSSEKKSGKMDTEGFKVPNVPQPSTSKRPLDAEPPKPKRQKVEGHSSDSQVDTSQRDKTRDDYSVFLSNLDYNLDDDRIKSIFCDVGEITVIRVVRDFRGRSKGFGYVEFKNKDSVEEALKKDRQPIDGRPMYVSKCIDKAKGSSEKKFRYSTGLDKCKLFVRGLPFTTTKQDLETMFGEHGNLKEARLVTYKNGKSKGLAFVDFRDEVSAATALLKLDGLVMGTNTISVALSNPPDRKTPMSSLGGGPPRDSTPGPRGRGRTQISLVPRALQRFPAPFGSIKTNLAAENQNGSGESGISTRSNQDFRNMLLGNK